MPPPARRQQLRQALSQARQFPAETGREIPRRVPPMRFPQVGGQRPRQGTGLKAPVKLGAQLQGRVQSGAISGAQAQKVARQRQLLQKALGSDWRTKVYGQGGAKGVSGPFAQGQIRADRSQALLRARGRLR